MARGTMSLSDYISIFDTRRIARSHLAGARLPRRSPNTAASTSVHVSTRRKHEHERRAPSLRATERNGNGHASQRAHLALPRSPRASSFSTLMLTLTLMLPLLPPIVPAPLHLLTGLPLPATSLRTIVAIANATERGKERACLTSFTPTDEFRRRHQTPRPRSCTRDTSLKYEQMNGLQPPVYTRNSPAFHSPARLSFPRIAETRRTPTNRTVHLFMGNAGEDSAKLLRPSAITVV